MHRILGLAVFPLRLIKVNPLPKGFMPKVGLSKAKGYLYPDDDARLLGCAEVPLEWRVWYGFLDREGPRTPAQETNGGSSSTSNDDSADASSGTEDSTCAQECAHADLDVANREVDPTGGHATPKARDASAAISRL